MVYGSEQEQIEAIRRWWQENGRSVIAGVVIALAGVFGWQGWQGWQESQALDAAQRYEAMGAAVSENDLEAARSELDRLGGAHPGNAHYLLAAFELASAYLAQDDAAAAVEVLRAAVENGENAALRRLARVRLAQALEAAGRPEAALEALAPIEEGPYLARAAELRGDIRLGMGDREAAVEAYRAAIEANPATQRRSLIATKLADLGESVDEARS